MIRWVHYTRGDPGGDPYPTTDALAFEEQLRASWPGPGAFSCNEARLDGPRAGECYAKAWLEEEKAQPWIAELAVGNLEGALELEMPPCVIEVNDAAEHRTRGLPLVKSSDWAGEGVAEA